MPNRTSVYDLKERAAIAPHALDDPLPSHFSVASARNPTCAQRCAFVQRWTDLEVVGLCCRWFCCLPLP
eukprot:4861894-Amphidinium_carterae.2